MRIRNRVTRALSAVALSALLLLSAVALTGCEGMSEAEVIQWIEDFLANPPTPSSPEGGPLSLTYPAGKSPKVFQKGWVFGAKCVVDGVDYSDQVEWTGTATFSPAKGSKSRPAFNSVGANRITLKVKVKGKLITKTYTIQTVSTVGFARQGDLALCPADAHGSPADPLPVIGPIIQGSPNVYIDGKPAARVGDAGVHAACAGPNTYTITGKSQYDVIINGRTAARIGDETRHCGGSGHIVSGSGGK